MRNLLPSSQEISRAISTLIHRFNPYWGKVASPPFSVNTKGKEKSTIKPLLSAPAQKMMDENFLTERIIEEVKKLTGDANTSLESSISQDFIDLFTLSNKVEEILGTSMPGNVSDDWITVRDIINSAKAQLEIAYSC